MYILTCMSSAGLNGSIFRVRLLYKFSNQTLLQLSGKLWVNLGLPKLFEAIFSLTTRPRVANR